MFTFPVLDPYCPLLAPQQHSWSPSYSPLCGWGPAWSPAWMMGSKVSWLQNSCISPLGLIALCNYCLCFLWALCSCSQRPLLSLLFCGRLMGHSGGNGYFASPAGFLGPSSIHSSITCKPCAGSSTLSPSRCFQMRESDPELRPVCIVHRAWENYQQGQKNFFFFLKNCFPRVAFSNAKSTFFVNLLSVAE